MQKLDEISYQSVITVFRNIVKMLKWMILGKNFE